MYYTVTPIFTGEFSVRFGFLPTVPDLLHIPNFCFLIISEDQEYFLVDAGFNSDHVPGVSSHGSHENLPIVLAQQGIDHQNIKNVIMTHLHWDHAAGLSWFEHADIYVQTQELRALISLDPIEECSFCPRHWLPVISQFVLLQGTTEIRPGLKTIYTGGHTGGHQVVLVNTRTGPKLIAGDAPLNYAMLWQTGTHDIWNTFRQDYQHFFWSEDDRVQIKNHLQKQQLLDVPAPQSMPFRELKADGYEIMFSHNPKISQK